MNKAIISRLFYYVYDWNERKSASSVLFSAMDRLQVEFLCRRNSFNKMIRRFRRPLKRLTTAVRRKMRRMRLGAWWHRAMEDGRAILEYSQIEGFNHLANRRINYVER